MGQHGDDGQIGDTREVWVTSRTSGTRVCRGQLVIQNLSGTVTRTIHLDGPNGPNGALTQYILAAAECHLYDQLVAGLGSPDADKTASLARMVPLETFGPDVLDISRNNLRRRWATSSDWLDDVIAYALRPGRALDHAQQAAAQAVDLMVQPLGDVIRAVVAGEIEAERDPARFRLAEIIRTVWPDHPVVRSSAATLDEYVMRWWVPVYELVLDVYGFDLLDGVEIEAFAWPLLTFVEHAARGADEGAVERATQSIVLLISGSVVDRGSGARLTPSEVLPRRPVTAGS